MTKSTTTPRFLQAAGSSGLAEEAGPWAQLDRAIGALRKAIDSEGNHLRRSDLIREHGALLARRDRGRMLKSLIEVARPLTFSARLDQQRRLEQIPDLVACLMDTVTGILYASRVPNRPALLEQSFAEFTAAMLEEGGPLGDTLSKATGPKLTVTEQLVALDLEIHKLEKAIAAERNSDRRQGLTQQLADLKRKREPLLAEKQKQHPGSDSKTPRAM